MDEVKALYKPTRVFFYLREQDIPPEEEENEIHVYLDIGEDDAASSNSS